MSEILEFLVRHGYVVLFAFAFAEQAGLPLPAVPVLLAAGALAGQGELSLLGLLAVSVLGAVVGDFLWYEIGRRKGAKVLSLLCRIALEPDSCVRKGENLFARHGAHSLLVAKFLPGLSTVAPPVAGMFHMSVGRFLFFDAAGASAWAGLFLGTGYFFADQLEEVAREALRLGSHLLILLTGMLAAYLGWKYAQRRRFLRELRIARLTPEALQQKLEAGERVFILDVRQALEREANPVRLPGAALIEPGQVQQQSVEIPGDHEIVVYCT